MAEFSINKPILRKLVCAVSHILPTKNTKFKHLLWRQFRPEVWMEVSPHRFSPEVHVIRLNQVINTYTCFLYRRL